MNAKQMQELKNYTYLFFCTQVGEFEKQFREKLSAYLKTTLGEQDTVTDKDLDDMINYHWSRYKAAK
jgi:hypothetical protein